METFKVIIFGSRDFKDKELLFEKCDFFLSRLPEEVEVEIVSGGQRSFDKYTETYHGADYFGELYAESRGYKLTKFPAPWEGLDDTPVSQMRKNRKGGLYWPGAGHYRNSEMEKYADAGIGFPVKGSPNKGTNNMLKLLEKAGKSVRII